MAPMFVGTVPVVSDDSATFRLDGEVLVKKLSDALGRRMVVLEGYGSASATARAIALAGASDDEHQCWARLS